MTAKKLGEWYGKVENRLKGFTAKWRRQGEEASTDRPLESMENEANG